MWPSMSYDLLSAVLGDIIWGLFPINEKCETCANETLEIMMIRMASLTKCADKSCNWGSDGVIGGYLFKYGAIKGRHSEVNDLGCFHALMLQLSIGFLSLISAFIFLSSEHA